MASPAARLANPAWLSWLSAPTAVPAKGVTAVVARVRVTAVPVYEGMSSVRGDSAVASDALRARRIDWPVASLATLTTW